MTLLQVVRTRHHKRKFLRRFMVLKIEPNTGQTLGTMDRRGRRRNMAKSKGPNSDCNINFFFKYEKFHDGGQT